MHKNPALTCQSCTEKFLGCDPRMVSFVKKVQEVFTDCHVAWGFRDQAQQHQDKVAGKSMFDWPESKHNFTLYGHPYSKACDLFMLGVDGQAYFLKEYYENIWRYYKDHWKEFGESNQYVWGGSWLHFKDLDHYEVKG